MNKVDLALSNSTFNEFREGHLGKTQSISSSKIDLCQTKMASILCGHDDAIEKEDEL